MALDATQKTQVYEIFEIPQNGLMTEVRALTSPFGPTGDTFEFSAVITMIEARLAALSAQQITRCATLLSRWTTITSTSTTRINDKSGTRTDHPEERKNIKKALADIIGVKLLFNTQNFNISR